MIYTSYYETGSLALWITHALLAASVDAERVVWTFALLCGTLALYSGLWKEHLLLRIHIKTIV